MPLRERSEPADGNKPFSYYFFLRARSQRLSLVGKRMGERTRPGYKRMFTVLELGAAIQLESDVGP
jgi:hypothetical protein